MTSLCKSANPIQPLQETMIDCLVHYPSNQYQENYQDPETFESHSTYRTEDLAVSGTSSPLLRYHAALAVGATVVCSAGAIMQHTKVGLWSPLDTGVPGANKANKNVIRLDRSESETQVLTPPVVSSQTRASTGVSFSSDSSDSSDTVCQEGTCKGLAFIEQRLPELQQQVRQSRVEMQAFQAQHTAQNLQTHRLLLADRSIDVARRQAELDGKSQHLDQQFASLTSALALQPEEAAQMAGLLKTDVAYQDLLGRLQGLQYDIAVEYSRPDLNNEQLEGLYTEYSQVAAQLRQIAQAVLAAYGSAASVESPDPLWQEDSYQALLQELMDLLHLRQMLAIEQGTLAQMDTKLTERRAELAVLLKQYAVMQRQLEGQNKVLQQYITKRRELQNTQNTQNM